MLDVVMRDGRVLRFNGATEVVFENGFVSVNEGKKYWHSKINVDLVERIDGVGPCKVMKERRDKKRMKPY